MCDYNMHAIASRPAQAGETIVSTDFRGSCTRGFASVEETEVAVCLLPGTELVFEQNVRRRSRWFGFIASSTEVGFSTQSDDPRRYDLGTFDFRPMVRRGRGGHSCPQSSLWDE